MVPNVLLIRYLSTRPSPAHVRPLSMTCHALPASEFGRGGGQRHAGQYSKERALGWASSESYITKKKHPQYKEKVTEEE